jgi:hypothetical protein
LRAALELPLSSPFQAVNAVSECLTVAQVAQHVATAARARGLQPRVVGNSAPADVAAIDVRTSLPKPDRQPAALADTVGEVVDYFRSRAAP